MRSGGFTAEDNSAAWPGVAHTRAGRQPAPVPPPDGGAPDLAVPDLGPVPPPQKDVFTPHGRAGGTLGAPKK